MIVQWLKRLKWMRISKYAIIITLLLSLVFAGFTVYGARIGNFNIYVDGNDLGFAIYMKEDKSDLGTHLSVPMLDDMTDTTFEDIAAQYVRDSIVNGLGPKNDEEHKRYLAFSFVLVNLSDRMVNYDFELTVIASEDGVGGKKVESAMRILLLREWKYDEGPTYEALETEAEKDRFFRDGKIYALAEETEDAKDQLKEFTNYETEDFISAVQLLKITETDFEASSEVKYTVVMWLEGWDVDCANAIMGGRIKMRLDITGRADVVA